MINPRIIKITNQSAIVLGKQGENIVAVHFPQPPELMDEEWVLNHRRATDALAYPVPLAKDGGDLVWAVTSGDTEIPGRGEAELVCRGKSGQVLKSRTYTTHVVPSVSAGGDVPDPVKPWYDAIMDALANGGGYYRPEMEQVSEEAVTVAFAANREDMPLVEPVTIRLLAGPPGEPGKPGQDGPPGKDGSPGQKGKTPEKGVDYWTEADRAAMVADTLAALPTWEGGSY